MSESKVSELYVKSERADNEVLHETFNEEDETVVVAESSSSNRESPKDEVSTHRDSSEEKKSERIRPNWFVALQISNEEILSRLSSIQVLRHFLNIPEHSQNFFCLIIW